MKIKGNIEKSGRWWAAEVPMLLVFTQGRTQKEACVMVKEAIEDLVDMPGFTVQVFLSKEKGAFYITSNDNRLLLTFVLKQQRAKRCLSVRDVARNLGSESPTAYSRYESGKVGLTLDKFAQLMEAIDPELDPILTCA